MSNDFQDIDKPKAYGQYEHAGNQPDEYVRCPYFPEHELRRSRLPYHIVKCERNPNAPKLLICPFNFLHRVRMEDRREHAIMCEDRIFHKYCDKELPSVGRTRMQLATTDRGETRQSQQESDVTEDGLKW